ncbi:MAG: transglutaminase domain-containing protein [Candidatus Omnitrophica bacterium]|nr:transglutaminase domain-containing protein [Candidatus Omnitrophota bacterium]
MLRTMTLLFITGFWLTMTSRLIQKEFFEISTYETSSQWIPLTTTAIREDYKAIYLGQERIGFEYIGMQKWDNKDGFFELGHNSFMSFSLLGQPSEMFIKDRAWLNQDLSLKSFRLLVKTKDYSTEMEGQVTAHHINVVLKEKDSEPVRKMIPVEGKVLYSEALEQLWTPDNLRIGKNGHFKVFHPLTLSVDDIHFHVERKEKIELRHEIQEAYVVILGNDLSETRSWVNQDGITLRKETANGLIIEREPAWETFDALRVKSASPLDLPNFYSVPSNMILNDPANLQELHVRVEMPGKTNDFTLKKQKTEGLEAILFTQLKKEEAAEFLKANEFIQSDDAKILQQAKTIVGDETSVLRAALKIMAWVHHDIKPVPTANIPSAKQVLAVKKGDCKEFTVLFTSLARAAGIPTQMIAGLVYQNGRFFYHAWAAVYLNQWIYVDPTFNQMPVDVTHIPLVIGNLNEQIALASKIGRIKVTVVEDHS